MKRLNQLTALAPVLALLACSSVVDMMSSLNKRIGNTAPDVRTGSARHYKKVEIDSSTYELQWERPDGCSYALIVKKPDNVIAGWRFLKEPAPKDCTFQNFVELI